MDISDVIFNTVDTDGDQRVNEAELQRAREQRAVPAWELRAGSSGRWTVEQFAVEALDST